MGITVFNDGERQYYRITRAWEDREYQEYVRIDGDRVKARREAEAIDRRLAKRQKASQLRGQLPFARLCHDDGRIVGLGKALNQRKGRAARWEFKLRIRVPGEPNPRFTSISIDQHGFNRAFELAIERICEWNGIDRYSETRKALLAARDHYRPNPEKHVITPLPSAAGQAGTDELEQALNREIEAFNRRRDVISGSG